MADIQKCIEKVKLWGSLEYKLNPNVSLKKKKSVNIWKMFTFQIADYHGH